MYSALVERAGAVVTGAMTIDRRTQVFDLPRDWPADLADRVLDRLHHRGTPPPVAVPAPRPW
ncbi:hypothetical protein I6A84_38625 [Frankia sp. CNm7]|uniref:Uncharacterized protein n=1 Tax=Frankia nepalensis TaxID=1836974 RepID=A0A937RJG6_9ACTN|nr:hypothetical protein [Frankia nepalensis]MBL7496515.1 hypothetical protein [Frankia nepalensis]MBL7508734.1 hypothetical protein [Frankia nepalensis]MBL7523803.1 hypothetical protein [Frankia nepalensis]MBL7627488.1 hypothetical protein [Frankia nepalensis]